MKQEIIDKSKELYPCDSTELSTPASVSIGGLHLMEQDAFCKGAEYNELKMMSKITELAKTYLLITTPAQVADLRLKKFMDALTK